MILSELLYKLVLFCDIVRVGKNSYCEFDKFEVYIAFARKIGGATGLNRIVKER